MLIFSFADLLVKIENVYVHFKRERDIKVYVSLFHNLMVLSFSRAAEAMMFSVGWQAVHKTTSVCP